MTAGAVMVFGAGFGSRMGALTKDRPKPLITVGGETLLDRALAQAERAGIGRRVVNTHYLGDRIAAHLEGRDVAISHEAEEILDTGGGLKAALPLLDADPVFTINPDAVFAGPNPFSVLSAAWDPGRMEALLLLVPAAAAEGRSGPGDFTLRSDGRLARRGDRVYTGAQILGTGRVARTPDRVFSLNRTWDAMAADGGLFGVAYPGRWCDVGHPGGVALAEAMLEGGDVRAR